MLGFLNILNPAKARRSMKSAVRNLWLHKLRSFLSVLGIIIGTAAVISLMAFGEGSMHEALEDIRKQGATNIIVMSVKPPEVSGTQQRSRVAKYGLTDEDYTRFRVTLPTIQDMMPMRVFANEIRPVTGNHAYNGRVVGTTPRYGVLYKLEEQLSSGRFLSDQDENPLPNNVVVLGAEVAHELFPAEDPINKKIRLTGKNPAFVVVGVLKERAPSTSGPDIEKFNGDIYMPIGTCRKMLGEVNMSRSSGSFTAEQVQLNQIILTVHNMDQVRPTAETVRTQLEMFHDSAKKDWDIKVPLDKLQDAEKTRDRYRVLLFFIAGISLLVGGIGIMNIMLATVTERTREIGIRRALGAKRGDITLQFLVEAIVQTTVGGLMGLGLGFSVIVGAPAIYEAFTSGHLPARIHVPSVFLAFSVAVIVGVLFGWYPSRRAAMLDPIEALRHE